MRYIIIVAILFLAVTAAQPFMSVKCFAAGNQIKVVIHENRAYYSNIFVVADAGAKLYKYTVTLNRSGYAVVFIPVEGCGTYRIYVRDTMGTLRGISLSQFMNEYYDLNPSSGFAKAIKADDDILVVKTVKVLAEVMPTVTPSVPMSTTPTPAATLTPTPTATSTPIPTPTPTSTSIPTSTPKKTPGFEAVLAVACMLAYFLRNFRKKP